MRGILIGPIAGVCVTFSTAAFAQDEPPPRADDRGTVTFVWENDSFADSDQNYTNGVRFAWLSGTDEPEGLSRWIARNLLGAGDEAVIRRGIAMGHSIFTPNDTSTSAPFPINIPTLLGSTVNTRRSWNNETKWISSPSNSASLDPALAGNGFKTSSTH